MASASVKIISDTVAKWREAGHPLRNHSTSTQFEVTPFPSEDGACRINHHSPRDKSEPGPEGRTPEAGGRSLVARMKQQWASFSGLLKDMAVAPRPHFGLEG
jgi:hypothetical protein